MPASRVCSVVGCPTLSATGGRCAEHQRQAEQIRGSAASRGYGNGHSRFRQQVLRRDPVCVMPECEAPSTVADHYPLSRRELVARGMNPNDPQHGRGLCASCHGKETAKHQPGGWNVR